MMLSSGKIPGHSGTDFKHKKAFQGNTLFGQSSLPRPNHFGTKVISQPESVGLRSLTRILKVFQVSLFLVTLVGVLYICRGSTQQAADYHQTIYLQKQDAEARDHEYRYGFFTSRANRFRRIGSWDAAQEEYQFALIANPEGEEALRGITLTLLAKCYLYQEECALAKTYLLSLSSEVQKEIAAVLQLEEILQPEEMGLTESLEP